MKKLLTTFAATILSLSAASISAEEVRGYAGLMGGLNSIISHKGTKDVAGVPTEYITKLKDHGFGGAFAGARWSSGLRLEAEYAYRQNKIKEYTDAGTLVVSVPADKARQQMQSLMANVYYDIPVENSPVIPFVGAGIGAARINTRGTTLGLTTHSKNKDVGMYQLMVGIDGRLNDSTRAGVTYSYYRCGHVRLDSRDVAGTSWKTKSQGHSVSANVKFEF
ncbi:MAG: hypothetical protein K0S07_1181 [Chlamydiales bacterium]|jgi:opacity protein-like surface antigen|nr:hypothetical protein [Chlamydiales bacterium]